MSFLLLQKPGGENSVVKVLSMGEPEGATSGSTVPVFLSFATPPKFFSRRRYEWSDRGAYVNLSPYLIEHFPYLPNTTA